MGYFAVDRVVAPASVTMPMIDNKKFAKSRPEDVLQRAYDVKSPEEAIDLYRDWAGSCDQQLEQGLRYLAPAVIAQMLSVAEPDHTVRVLDVGCGTGLVGVSLSKLGFVHMDGLDFSSQMLNEARRKGVYRELIQADLSESLDLTPSTYWSSNFVWNVYPRSCGCTRVGSNCTPVETRRNFCLHDPSSRVGGGGVCKNLGAPWVGWRARDRRALRPGLFLRIRARWSFLSASPVPPQAQAHS